MPAIVQPVRRPPTAPAMNGQMDFKAALSIPAQSISSFMLLFPFLVLVMVCVRFALCHLPVGRVGRVRRVGYLIFKKEMPESCALGRCLGFLVENCFRKAPQVNFMKPLSYSSYASYTSYFDIASAKPNASQCRLPFSEREAHFQSERSL